MPPSNEAAYYLAPMRINHVGKKFKTYSLPINHSKKAKCAEHIADIQSYTTLSVASSRNRSLYESDESLSFGVRQNR